MAGRAITPSDEDETRRRLDAETRLRETHHRVNNHLQVLVGLIGLQIRSEPSADVQEALGHVRRRILAVARLHGELREGRGDESIDIARFFAGLSEDFRLAFGADDPGRLRLEFQVAPAQMALERAVTVGLIANELIANAVKHTPRVQTAHVRVRLGREAGLWRLTVADDGPGLPPDAFSRDDRQGLELVRLLALKLKGSVQADRPSHGASISTYFT